MTARTAVPLRHEMPMEKETVEPLNAVHAVSASHHRSYRSPPLPWLLMGGAGTGEHTGGRGVKSPLWRLSSLRRSCGSQPRGSSIGRDAQAGQSAQGAMQHWQAWQTHAEPTPIGRFGDGDG